LNKGLKQINPNGHLVATTLTTTKDSQ
jgi:hypothetical protein